MAFTVLDIILLILAVSIVLTGFIIGAQETVERVKENNGTFCHDTDSCSDRPRELDTDKIRQEWEAVPI